MGNEFKITPKDGGYTIKGSKPPISYERDGILVTKEDLIDALFQLSDSDNLLAELQKKQLAKEKQQYDLLKPEGFDLYSPSQAKVYRSYLEEDKDIKKMKWLKETLGISYNPDGTINILKIKKIFCEDISGKNSSLYYDSAKDLAEEKGYKLMSDYNDEDTPEEQQATDFYTIISLFNPHGEGVGETDDAKTIFRYMTGYGDGHWTDTPCKDSKLGLNPFIRIREGDLKRNGVNPSVFKNNNQHRVCGRKDME